MDENTATDGYEGVTHAGIAVVRFDGTPMVFMAQRAYDETDAPDVQETWEVPGGALAAGEEPFAAASREFEEEIGFPLPEGEVINGGHGAEFPREVDGLDDGHGGPS